MYDIDGKQFVYICPICQGDVEGCPDPACQQDNVGHHVEDKNCPGNGEIKGDVVLDQCEKRYK